MGYLQYSKSVWHYFQYFGILAVRNCNYLHASNNYFLGMGPLFYSFVFPGVWYFCCCEIFFWGPFPYHIWGIFHNFYSIFVDLLSCVPYQLAGIIWFRSLENCSIHSPWLLLFFTASVARLIPFHNNVWVLLTLSLFY